MASGFESDNSSGSAWVPNRDAPRMPKFGERLESDFLAGRKRNPSEGKDTATRVSTQGYSLTGGKQAPRAKAPRPSQSQARTAQNPARPPFPWESPQRKQSNPYRDQPPASLRSQYPGAPQGQNSRASYPPPSGYAGGGYPSTTSTESWRAADGSYNIPTPQKQANYRRTVEFDPNSPAVKAFRWILLSIFASFILVFIIGFVNVFSNMP